MACPYFYPTSTLTLGYWGKRSRLPLGDLFAGVCHADPDAAFLPDEDTLRDCCNLGYARCQCPRFPQQSGPDAVRFAVSAEASGSVRIAFAIERDHRPHQCGTLEYDFQRQAFPGAPAPAVLLRQAEAFVSSYLRRKLAQRPQRVGQPG